MIFSLAQRPYLWILAVSLNLLFFATVGFSKNVVINENPLSAKARLEPTLISAGGTSTLVIEMNLAPGHHAYLDQFKLEALAPETLSVGDFDVAPVMAFFDKFSKKERKGIKDKAILRAEVHAPPQISSGAINLHVNLTYQACTDEYCLWPKKIPLSVTAQVAGQNKAATSTISSGDLFDFEKALEHGWLVTFAVVFLAGILTSFTPCIFPMIPITLAVLGAKTAGRKKLTGFLLSVTYTLGIAFTYAALGLFAASTGKLFGSLLGHPVVVGFIALVFVAMALSMFGLYDIQVPAFIANRLGNKKTENGFVGAFLTGLFAGIVASPCVGPVLIGVLTFVAQSQDLFLGFWLLFTFALGMGLLFIALGTFSQISKLLPKSGPWMNRVKYLFGVVFIIMAAYYVYPIVPQEWRPGRDSSSDHSRSKVNWTKYSEEILQGALAKGQPVILDFYADWCIACKELDYETFSSPEVQKATEGFTWLQFDATQGSKEFDELIRKYKIQGLPHVVFFDQEGRWRESITLKYFEKTEDFLKRLEELKTP